MKPCLITQIKFSFYFPIKEDSFTAYYKEAFLKKHYKANESPIDFLDQHPDNEEVLTFHRVERKAFELYTISSEQNETLELAEI